MGIVAKLGAGVQGRHLGDRIGIKLLRAVCLTICVLVKQVQ